jgi:hypothetical protein
MERKPQTGYLVLADISGFTSFVAKTEIDHADMALSFLLETIVEKIGSLLKIVQLEGDAVFAYLEESQLPEAKSMLGLIDATYLAFREKALALHSHTTCPCRACEALPTLDLKFMVHRGEFLISQVAGTSRLLGTDVNLLHRLAKNHVSEYTGWQGYVLFTDQTMDHLQINRDKLFKQAESYEHLGHVETYVMDMHVRYAEMKAS